MLSILKKKINKDYRPPEEPNTPIVNIKNILMENIIYIKTQCGTSFDVVIRQTAVDGTQIAFVQFDGMCKNFVVDSSIVNPILNADDFPSSPADKYSYIRDSVVSEVDYKELVDIDESIDYAMAGFLLLFVDGVDRCLAFSVQGYENRSIQDPITEVQSKGARDGFVENFKTNVTLIRRRLRNPKLRFEMITLGRFSKTRICLCYVSDRVDSKVLEEVKTRLNKANVLDTVLSVGYIQTFLDTERVTPFTAVGTTERPDVMCAKVTEGRIGVLVDGSPYALIVPYLFMENFQSLDDYALKPFYAIFTRILKIISFTISIFLPGTYVAVSIFHPEVFPQDMLYDILGSEMNTPFPVMYEALLIHFIFEVMREAGLRMPATVGHAVSIVGALVIGDAAVTAGLIATPMLIVVALTAISSFVVPAIYEPVAVLRLVFIIIGGTLGLYGMVIGFMLILINITAIEPYGIQFSAPLSPFSFSALRDVVIRSDWRNLAGRVMLLNRLKGVKK